MRGVFGAGRRSVSGLAEQVLNEKHTRDDSLACRCEIAVDCRVDEAMQGDTGEADRRGFKDGGIYRAKPGGGRTDGGDALCVLYASAAGGVERVYGTDRKRA